MARRILTVMKYEEIKRLMGLGLSDRQVAKSLKCSRDTVRGIREGKVLLPGAPKVIEWPIWAKLLNWDEICRERSLGYELKYIWEERAKESTTYSNFWKQFYRQFPQYREAGVVHREFKPGEYCEVDWAGSHLEWVSARTGEVHQVSVFVGILCFSQLMFSVAKENQKSHHWIEAHRQMYEYFGGVPHVTVPDCLKTGVTKYHLYDPDLNDTYMHLARHYGTAIVPARAYHPKDKALAENMVGRFMRYFKFKYRNYIFCSLLDINRGIRETTDEINFKPHSRFKVSRRDRWEAMEKKHLKPLPISPYEYEEWKDARIHPDSYVAAEHNFYSAPHIHRGKQVRVKLASTQVEIFLGLERIALHPRHRAKRGEHITNPDHLPPNARAYYETTPQNVLSQAKYVNGDLYGLIDGLFQKDALGNLRRAQGLVRVSRKEINGLGKQEGDTHISRACQTMRRFSKIRVPYFRELLKHYRKEKFVYENKNIVRSLNNSMLRYQKLELGDSEVAPNSDKRKYESQILAKGEENGHQSDKTLNG